MWACSPSHQPTNWWWFVVLIVLESVTVLGFSTNIIEVNKYSWSLPLLFIHSIQCIDRIALPQTEKWLRNLRYAIFTTEVIYFQPFNFRRCRNAFCLRARVNADKQPACSHIWLWWIMIDLVERKSFTFEKTKWVGNELFCSREIRFSSLVFTSSSSGKLNFLRT